MVVDYFKNLFCYLERDTSQVIPLRSNFPRLRPVQLADSRMHARDVDDSGEMLYFDLSIILTATNNFSEVNKLGEGGFGPVYKVTIYKYFLSYAIFEII